MSALLYHRAVKIQRFLEPALAISQPRNHFAEHINSLITKEFGADEVQGVKLISGSIFVEDSILFDGSSRLRESAPAILKKLSNVFLALMKDREINPYVDLILVSARFPVSADIEVNRKMRLMQFKSDLILNSLFKLAPQLEREYSGFFAATYVPVDPSRKRANLIEFRIIPSEQLHIDVLQRLRKYVN